MPGTERRFDTDALVDFALIRKKVENLLAEVVIERMFYIDSQSLLVPHEEFSSGF